MRIGFGKIIDTIESGYKSITKGFNYVFNLKEPFDKLIKVVLPVFEVIARFTGLSAVSGIIKHLNNVKDVTGAANILDRLDEWTDPDRREGVTKSLPKALGRGFLTVTHGIDTLLFVNKLVENTKLLTTSQVSVLGYVKNAAVVVSAGFSIYSCAEEIKNAKKQATRANRKLADWKTVSDQFKTGSESYKILPSVMDQSIKLDQLIASIRPDDSDLKAIGKQLHQAENSKSVKDWSTLKDLCESYINKISNQKEKLEFTKLVQLCDEMIKKINFNHAQINEIMGEDEFKTNLKIQLNNAEKSNKIEDWEHIKNICDAQLTALNNKIVNDEKTEERSKKSIQYFINLSILCENMRKVIEHNQLKIDKFTEVSNKWTRLSKKIERAMESKKPKHWKAAEDICNRQIKKLDDDLNQDNATKVEKKKRALSLFKRLSILFKRMSAKNTDEQKRIGDLLKKRFTKEVNFANAKRAKWEQYQKAVNHGNVNKVLNYKINGKWEKVVKNNKIDQKRSWVSIAAEIAKIMVVCLVMGLTIAGIIPVAFGALMPLVPFLFLHCTGFVTNGIGFIKTLHKNFGEQKARINKFYWMPPRAPHQLHA